MVPRPWLIFEVLELGGHRSSMQRLVGGGMDFLRHASVGDELKVTDHDGSDLEESARWASPRWTAGGTRTLGMPDGFG